jgi:type I restriction enzyme S subunit
MKYPKDWKQTKLKNCSLISGEYGINAAGVPFSENLPKYLRITDIDDSSNVLRLNNMVSVDNTESHKFLLADKDIVFARTGASVGKTYLHNQEKYGGLVFAGFLIRFRLDSKILLPEFLYQFCETNEYWNWVKMTSQRSGQPGVNSQEFGQLTFPLPPFPEQQKIAAILSKWDELIETQTQLITTKEKQKTSLMQKLLTGEVRFPGFEDEWETVELGKVGQVINGLTYCPEDIHEKGVLVLRSSNVQNRRLAFKDNVYVNVEEGKFNPVQENDILICVRNGSQDLIGKNAIINKANEGVAFGAFMTVYRSKYNPFFFHLFDTPIYNKEVYKNLGATINSINGSDLKKFKMPFPSIEEQNKITALLDSMDKEVASLSEELESLKLQKKGLMQQLLTGKVRVKA